MPKKILFISSILFIIIMGGLWSIVSGGYDKQNKVILFLKKVIPTNVARKVRDTVFIIPNLKDRNEFLSKQVAKYEQGYNGELFNEEVFFTNKKKEKYILKEFFLPFPRLDTRLGWKAKKKKKRAHYLEIVKDKIFSISGLGETIYFEKKKFKIRKIKSKKNWK